MRASSSARVKRDFVGAGFASCRRFPATQRRRREGGVTKYLARAAMSLATSRVGEELGFADELGGKDDFREVLERFHAEEGGEQIIGPAGGGPMIGEKERVVVRHVRLELPRTNLRARGGVANEEEPCRGRRSLRAEALWSRPSPQRAKPVAVGGWLWQIALTSGRMR